MNFAGNRYYCNAYQIWLDAFSRHRSAMYNAQCSSTVLDSRYFERHREYDYHESAFLFYIETVVLSCY